MSDAERHDRLYAIFNEACELPEDERAAFLDRACGEDAALRQEVEDLLAIDEHESSGAWRLDRHAMSGDGDSAASAERYSTAAPMPERIGPYRVLEVIGEGGMGMVYRAEQENPRRDVALKVIRPGVASTRTLKRFELEAHALGRLHHHGIAQIYEAGMFDSGAGPQPFFAMEFLEGKPLLDYVTDHQLGLRDRLELLIRICDAVDHAHSKCVIHRDLKPINIIVTGGMTHRTSATSDTLDLLGQPKVLDFGVARVTDSDIQTTTIGTDIGQLVGTLPYMSPEQVGGQPDDLDTRSDVYALGVIGYELLTNRRPHELAGKSLPAAVRIIREDDPTPIGSIDRGYRGDLETIIGKALEKEKQRRYQSPRDFAEDLRRYLRNEPITARPPSTFYQVRKYVQRNRAMVTGLSIALVALLLGVVGAVWAQAERQAYLETASMFKEQLKRSLEPPEDGDPLRPQEVDRRWLAEATMFVDRRLRREPLEAAELRNLIGLSYLNLDEYHLARQQLEQSLQVRRHHLRPPHQHLAESLHNMGRVLWHIDEFAEAEAYYREALAMLRELHGLVHPDVAETITHIAACLRERGVLDEAEDLYREALNMRETHFAQNRDAIAANYHNLAGCLMRGGRYAEAALMSERAIEIIREIADPEDLRIARGMRRLGACLTTLGEYDRAQSLLDEALRMQQRVRGSHNRDVAEIYYKLAMLHRQRGELERSRELARRALDIQRDLLGDQLDTSRTLELLGSIQLEQGRPHQAVELLWEALVICTLRRIADHPDVLRTRDLLHDAAVAVGDVKYVMSLLNTSPAARQNFPDRIAEERDNLIRRLKESAERDRQSQAELLVP